MDTASLTQPASERSEPDSHGLAGSRHDQADQSPSFAVLQRQGREGMIWRLRQVNDWQPIIRTI